MNTTMLLAHFGTHFWFERLESMNFLQDTDWKISKRELKKSNLSDENAIDGFLRDEFQEFLDKAHRSNMIKSSIKLNPNDDFSTILENIRAQLKDNESRRDAKKNRKLARKLGVFVDSIVDYQKELKLAESERIQQFTILIRSLRDEIAGDRVALAEQWLGAQIEDETDSMVMPNHKEVSGRESKKITKRLDTLEERIVAKQEKIDEGKSTARVERKEKKDLQKAQQHMKEYVDVLTTSWPTIQVVDAIGGEVVDSKTIKSNDQVILWFLLSDINFDARVLRTPDKGDYIRKTWLGSRLWGSQYKERKFARDFKQTARESVTETQIYEAYQKAIFDLYATNVANPSTVVAQNIAWFINTLIQGRSSWPQPIDLKTINSPKDLTNLFTNDPRYLDIFREQGLYLFPGTIYDIFKSWPEAYTALFEQTADMTAHNFDLQSFTNTYDQLKATHPEIDQLENLSNKKIDKLIAEIKKTIDANKSTSQWTLNDDQIAQLEAFAKDLKENRNLHKRNFTIGWLALFFQAHHLMGYTNNQGQKVPGKTWLDAVWLGVWGTLWQDLIWDYTQNISWWLGVVWANYYNEKKSSVEMWPNVWVSIWYNATKQFGSRIGNTNYKTWNIWYGLWVWTGIGTGTNDKFTFSPYIYAMTEAMVNKRKLTNTLDRKSAQYIWVWAWATLFDIAPALRWRQDKIAWVDIISDSIYTKTKEIFEWVFTNYKNKPIDQLTYSTIYDSIKQSLGSSFDKSKDKTIVKHAMLITGIINTLKPGMATNTLWDEQITLISDMVAYNYSLNRYNQNLDKLKGLSIESITASINPATLFGLANTGFAVFRNTTTSDDLRSTGEAITRVNRNTGAQQLFETDQKKNKKELITLWDIVTLKLITDDLKTNPDYIKINWGSVLISPELARIAKLQIRIKPWYEQYLSQNKDGQLVVPSGMVSGYSTILQWNQTIRVLSFGYEVEESLVPWNERRWSKELYKWIPNNKTGATISGLTLHEKPTKPYRTHESWTWDDVTVDGGNITWIKSVLDNLLGDDKWLITSQSFDPNTSVLKLNLQWNSENPIPFELKGDKIYTFTYNKKEKTLHVDRENWTTWSGIVFVYETMEPSQVETQSTTPIQFSDYSDHIDSAYRSMARDIDHSSSILLKSNSAHKEILHAFDRAMDERKFAVAATWANKLMKLLKKTWYTFNASGINELYDLSKRLISSSICEIDGDKVTARGLGPKMKSRTEWFERRWKNGSETNKTPFGLIESYRNKALQNMFTTAKNGLTMDNYMTTNSDYGFDIDRASGNNTLALIYGYAGRNNTQNEKLIIWTEKVAGSSTPLDGTTSDDDTLRRYVWSQIMTRYNDTKWSGENNLVQSLMRWLWSIDPTIIPTIMTEFWSGKQEVSITIDGKPKIIKANYEFFFYPDCLNESVGVTFDVVESQLTDNNITKKEWEVKLDENNILPAQESWFFTNVASVAQRAAITATRFSLTGGVRVIKSVQTTPWVDNGWEVTTEPWVIEIDGQKIDVSKQTNTVYTVNGKTINIEYVWVDGNGKPYYSVVITDATWNSVLAKFGSYDELINHINGIEPGLLNNFKILDGGYTSVLNPTTWLPTAPQSWIQRVRSNPLFNNTNPAGAVANIVSALEWEYRTKHGKSRPTWMKQAVVGQLSWYIDQIETESDNAK